MYLSLSAWQNDFQHGLRIYTSLNYIENTSFTSCTVYQKRVESIRLKLSQTKIWFNDHGDRAVETLTFAIEL